MRLLAIPLLALPLACSLDSDSQTGSGDDELADTGSETNADGPGTTESGDGDGDPTSDTSTDDATSDTTESTTDTTDTTDTTESTTDTTDTTDATDTTESTETTTDTGMEDTYYANCPGGNDDCVIGEVCKQDPNLGDDWQVCALLCENSGDCPDFPGHPLTCISYLLQDSACHIDCDNTPCPQGMSCKAVNIGIDHICVWDS
jgi:hypothetical protein